MMPTFCRRAKIRRRLSRSSRGLLVALALVSSGLGAGAGVDASSAAVAPVTTQWYQYHGNALGTGVALGIRRVNLAAPAWTSRPLDGQIYGEPLIDGSDVIVATENDSVYALSSRTGRVVWSHHVATAVPSSDLPCGDISPSVGVTGTPVVDPARHELFVADLQLVDHVARHYLYGLNVATGAVMMRTAIDLPVALGGGDAKAYLQRTGLSLDHGAVIFAMGGNYGDCPTYHGVVGAVSETGAGAVKYFVVDAAPGDSQGAVWMGGAAPAVDAAGDVWVETGNGSVTSAGGAYDHSDGVLELSASMRLKSFFAPTSWRQNNAADADLSAEPVLLSDGQVVATGKSGRVYLLNAHHLGGIGGEEVAIDSHCGNVLDGGASVLGLTVYLPCANGPLAVRVSTHPASVKVIWRARVGAGPPILAAQRLWTIDQSGVLYGLSPTTGAVEQQARLGSLANHFSTPSVGDGLLVATNATQVVAFHATS